MNANCALYPKVSLGLGFKNPTREDSYLKSATPWLSWIWWVKCILRYIPPGEWVERTTKKQRLIDPNALLELSEIPDRTQILKPLLDK